MRVICARSTMGMRIFLWVWSGHDNARAQREARLRAHGSLAQAPCADRPVWVICCNTRAINFKAPCVILNINNPGVRYVSNVCISWSPLQLQQLATNVHVHYTLYMTLYCSILRYRTIWDILLSRRKIFIVSQGKYSLVARPQMMRQ